MSRKRNIKKQMFQSMTECIDSLAMDDIAGRPFQRLEPAARNVQSPMVACHTLGTSSRCVCTDRSRCLLGMSATRIRSSTRYWGANPCNDLKTNIVSLSEGWRASQWCGLSDEDQRRIVQRRWAQIGDDDTGKPEFRSGWSSRSPGDSVPALWPASVTSIW